MTENLHDGHRERVRERFLKNGLESFEDHQILEMYLFNFYPRRDTNEIAHKMILEFGSLQNLLEANPLDIMARCKVSKNVAASIAFISAFAREYYVRRWNVRMRLTNSDLAAKYAISLFTGKSVEMFYALCLDNSRTLLQTALIAEGSLTESPVYPRKIAEIAFRFKATGLILTHNHPGGTLAASDADIETTEIIISALEHFEIEVIDHIIICGDKYISLRKKMTRMFNNY